MSVAENIKKIIKEEGYKQSAIAQKVGMSEKQFNALLNGRKTFAADYLPKICRAIGRSPNEVFGFSDIEVR